MKALLLALVISACGPRGDSPQPSGPAAHRVPVEISWPDAGAPTAPLADAGG